MNANEVLIDLLEDNRRRLKRVLQSLNAEGLDWRPDAQGNSIALTAWHMGRIFDVFLTVQARGEPAEEECWFRGGWARRSGYDPRGVGQNGWGMLTGYSLHDVAAVSRFSRELILGYLDEVYDMVKGYLADMPIENLLEAAAGFDGRYSRYQCVQMALLDNVRHLGEIYALKASWQRLSGEGHEALTEVGW